MTPREAALADLVERAVAAMEKTACQARALLLEIRSQSVEVAPAPEACGYAPQIKRTPEREALVRRDYPQGVPLHDLIKAVNALPGPAMTVQGLSTWVSNIGVKRDDGARRATLFPGGPPTRTDARAALLRESYPAGEPVDALLERVNALPGVTMTAQGLKRWICLLGLRRQPGSEGESAPSIVRRTPSRRTPERRVLLSELYPSPVSKSVIVTRINALPGDPMTEVGVVAWAKELRLRRPARGTVKLVREACAPAPVTAPLVFEKKPQKVFQKPAEIAGEPRPVSRPPVKFATPGPKLSDTFKRTAAPLVVKRADDTAEQVAAFIAAHGVTRCPAAAVGATTALLSAEDRAAVKAHNDRLADERQAVIMANARRAAANRRRKACGLTPIPSADAR